MNGREYNPQYTSDPNDSEGYMRKLLDDMAAKFIRPGAHFDRNYLKKLETCIDKYDDPILKKS